MFLCQPQELYENERRKLVELVTNPVRMIYKQRTERLVKVEGLLAAFGDTNLLKKGMKQVFEVWYLLADKMFCQPHNTLHSQLPE